MGFGWVVLLRVLCSLTLPAGWTTPTPHPLTNIIHVANDGNDQTGTGTQGAPYQTLQYAVSQLRDGYPDWLLLKRGDVWAESFGAWNLSGLDEEAPLVISYWGANTDPRPVIQAEESVFSFYGDVEHVAFLGLDLQIAPGERGIDISIPVTAFNDILIEDCRFTGGLSGILIARRDPITFEPLPVHDVTIRRCVVADSTVIGIFVVSFVNLLIEECIIDDNGTSETHDHNLYIINGTGATIRNNVSTRGANMGLKFRGPHTDAVIHNNVFALNKQACIIQVKYVGEQNEGIEFTRNVVVSNGKPAHEGFSAFMTGLAVDGTRNLLIADNIFCNSPQPESPSFVPGPALNFKWMQKYPFINDDGEPTVCDAQHPDWAVLQDIIVTHNTFYNWENTCIEFSVCTATSSDSGEKECGCLDPIPVEYDNITVKWNIFQNPNPNPARPFLIRDPFPVDQAAFHSTGNAYYQDFYSDEWFETPDGRRYSCNEWIAAFGEQQSVCVEMDFDEPLVDLDTYDAWLGGDGTFENLMARLRAQARYNWDEELTAQSIVDYFRHAFRYETFFPVLDNGCPPYYGAVPFADCQQSDSGDE